MFIMRRIGRRELNLGANQIVVKAYDKMQVGY
jgi:hypothetical protein